jgi:hypothetical protein
MKLQSLAAAVLLGAVVSSSFALDEVLPPLNPSASFDNTVSGAFQDTFQFSLTGLSIVAVSITNNEINSGGSSFGGILGFTGFVDLPVGADVPLTYSTATIPGPGGSTINVQRLEGNGQLPLGTYTILVSGTGITGSTASYGGNVVATPVPEPETYAMMLAGLGAIGFLVARRRNRA